MHTHDLVADFGRSRTARLQLTQYDRGQRVRLVGANIAPTICVQWASAVMTVIQPIDMDEDVSYVNIPDEILEKPGLAHGHVMESDGDSIRSLYVINVTIVPRDGAPEIQRGHHGKTGQRRSEASPGPGQGEVKVLLDQIKNLTKKIEADHIRYLNEIRAEVDRFERLKDQMKGSD